MKKKYLIKITVSLLMLGIVVYYSDISNLIDTIMNLSVVTVVTSALIYTIGQIISAYKWFIILQYNSSNSEKISFPKALWAYFIGMYVNCFGLGVVGGDVTRGVLISDGNNLSKTKGILSVLVDRVQGLLILILMGVTAAIIYKKYLIDQNLFFILCGIGALILIGWIFSAKIVKAMPEKLISYTLKERIINIIDTFPKQKNIVIKITLISVLFHILQISLHFYIIKGLGAYVPFQYLLISIPFVNILSSLPISWQGLGVRENAYLYFLAGKYLTIEQVIALGATWLFAVTISAAIGGVLSYISGGVKITNS